MGPQYLAITSTDYEWGKYLVLLNWSTLGVAGRKYSFSENFHRDQLKHRGLQTKSLSCSLIPSSPDTEVLLKLNLHPTLFGTVSSPSPPAIPSENCQLRPPHFSSFLRSTSSAISIAAPIGQNVSRQPCRRVLPPKQCHQGPPGSYLHPQQQPPLEALPGPAELGLHLLRRPRRPDSSPDTPYSRISHS